MLFRSYRKRFHYDDDLPTIGYLQHLHVGVLADSMERAAVLASAGRRQAQVHMAPWCGRGREANKPVCHAIEEMCGLTVAERAAGWRVALAHIELLSGFGLITLGVATRVVFGHSGERTQLERFHPPLTIAAVLLLLALLNRLTGDLVPSTMASHYLYAALCWLGGTLLWATRVLPKVLKPDPEE